MTTALLIVYALFLLATLLSAAYFARLRMPQPPLGVMNLWDVALTMIVIVLIPYLHLLLPSWANTLFLSLVTAGLFLFLLEPVIAARGLRWLVVLGLVAAGVAAAYLLPAGGPAYTAINNVLIILSVIALSNVWVQSGVSARDLVILSLAIALYDFIFTGRLPVTADMFAQLENLPFAPMIAWRVGDVWPAIGLGDTLLSAAFVVVCYKAWGRPATAIAFAGMALSLPLLFVLPSLSSIFVTAAYPAMVIIGPVQALIYFVLRRRYGPERPMQAFLATRRA